MSRTPEHTFVKAHLKWSADIASLFDLFHKPVEPPVQAVYREPTLFVLWHGPEGELRLLTHLLPSYLTQNLAPISDLCLNIIYVLHCGSSRWFQLW